MSCLRTLFALPAMWIHMVRVGLGFTVHSPFAYYFIRCVLRERLPYYCFRDEVTARADRRLFRVAAYFNPLTVAFIGGGDASRTRRIISLASRWNGAEAPAAEADFVYVAPGADIPAAFKVLYAERAAAIPPGAMTFTNGRTLIAVRRHGLPAQSFRLRF